MLNPAAVPKQITIYDMNGEVVASFYGAVRPAEYATLFEDAGNVYMVECEPRPVTD
ncbi:MAG: hypothetical protein JFAIHJKO_02777 [Pyrinomonadaceae bacterium]|nr:hypothetical protein [Pyrinomonadaceae bacterium]